MGGILNKCHCKMQCKVHFSVCKYNILMNRFTIIYTKCVKLHVIKLCVLDNISITYLMLL